MTKIQQIDTTATQPPASLEAQVLNLQNSYNQAKKLHNFMAMEAISPELHRLRHALVLQRAIEELRELNFFPDVLNYQEDTLLLETSINEFIARQGKLPLNNRLSKTHLLRCALATAGLKTAIAYDFVKQGDNASLTNFLGKTFDLYKEVDPENPSQYDLEELVLNVDLAVNRHS